MSAPQNNRACTSINQRRSQRILLAVPLLVTGKRPGSGAFSERTSTIVVSAHGALLRLKGLVQVGQTLTLKNVGTKEEIACAVMDMNSRDRETPEIGVEVANTCPRFWRVSFPPANWNPRCPEAKQVVQPKAVPSAANTAPPSVKRL